MATFRGTRADRLAKPATARRRSEREQERHTFRSNGWSTTFDPQASPEYAKRHDLVLATFPPTLTGFNAFYEARRGRPSPRPGCGGCSVPTVTKSEHSEHELRDLRWFACVDGRSEDALRKLSS